MRRFDANVFFMLSNSLYFNDVDLGTSIISIVELLYLHMSTLIYPFTTISTLAIFTHTRKIWLTSEFGR